MTATKVTSREYKLVLETRKFKGAESEVIKKATAFWAALKKNIPATALATGELGTISETREIRFYDTKDTLLCSNQYIFRERKDLLKGNREVTLKFRHPDRYIAQDRNMQPESSGKVKVKFEEDIKAEFITLYSFSGTAVIAPEKKMGSIKDIIGVFPGLGETIDKKAVTKPIRLVNDLALKEIVITGAQIQLCSTPEVSAECALIFWYNMDKKTERPLIAEFSFRYGDKEEQYNKETAQNAYDLFLLLQNKMKKWFDASGGTKTGLVFGG